MDGQSAISLLINLTMCFKGSTFPFNIFVTEHALHSPTQISITKLADTPILHTPYFINNWFALSSHNSFIFHQILPSNPNPHKWLPSTVNCHHQVPSPNNLIPSTANNCQQKQHHNHHA